MEMKRTRFLLLGLSAAILLLASGPDTGISFLPGHFPDNEADFTAGKLGLIIPGATTRELIEFRYLSGLKLSIAAATNGGQRQAVLDDHPTDFPVVVWRKARNTVAPRPQTECCQDTYRMSRTSKDTWYLNCHDDAFLTAARTLADRARTYARPAELQSWVEGQDLVFANCSDFPAHDSPSIPVDPEPNFSEMARADRDYQIAAAHFYSEDFDIAENLFRKIAADRSSPWRSTASYMVARTLLREFSLEGKSSAADAARAQFQAVAEDSTAGTLRDSARGMVEHIDAVQHSSDTLQALSEGVMAPQPDASFTRTLEESRYVILAPSFHGAMTNSEVPEPFDWVHTLDSGNEAHAVDRWRATHSLPWLTVALIHATKQEPAVPDLLEAASHVPADSPAFTTVTYNAIRLRLDRGELNGLRPQLNRLLANERTETPSVRNAWRAERIRVAISFDDFLHFAPRIPIDFANDPVLNSAVLADDSIFVLNYRAPLSKLVEAVHSPRISAWSSSQLALRAWTRAFMLEDTAAMISVAPVILKAHPAWAAVELTPPPQVDDAWRFRTSLLIARNAAFTPLLEVETRQPSYSYSYDSWWCGINEPHETQGAYRPNVGWRLSNSMEPPDAVFSPSERAEAKKEADRLRKLGSAQDVIGSVVLAWAKAHPDDPLVPEALYRVVRVVRYGCHAEPDNGKLSKTAFDLLHTRYPKNPWTAKTPYWFK
jgi:hypothetical protein